MYIYNHVRTSLIGLFRISFGISEYPSVYQNILNQINTFFEKKIRKINFFMWWGQNSKVKTNFFAFLGSKWSIFTLFFFLYKKLSIKNFIF